MSLRRALDRRERERVAPGLGVVEDDPGDAADDQEQGDHEPRGEELVVLIRGGDRRGLRHCCSWRLDEGAGARDACQGRPTPTGGYRSRHAHPVPLAPGRRRAWRVATPLIILASRGPLRRQRGAERRHRPARGAAHRPGLRGPCRARRDRRADREVRHAQRRGRDPLHAARRPVGRPGSQDEIADPGRPGGAHREDRAGPSRSSLDDAPRSRAWPTRATPTTSSCTSRTSRPSPTRCGRPAPTAVTIQGQRLISTTGIKCEGNQVTLHGVPYSPPYVIVGVGDPAAIECGADHRPDPRDLPRLHPDPRRQRRVGHEPARAGGRAGLRGSARPHLGHPDVELTRARSADSSAS